MKESKRKPKKETERRKVAMHGRKGTYLRRKAEGRTNK